jgi:riboflavin synthase
MFNGIIFHTGKIKSIERSKKSITIGVQTNLRLSINDIGSSIGCDGVCLTITKIRKKAVFFYISNETLKRSNFKSLKLNQIINLEKSLSYGTIISGHFSQGHVDTTAKIKKIKFIDKTWLIKLQISDKNYIKYLIEKASITINGVSLTISKVSKNFFEVNVIPHTLKLTNLNKLKANSLVNVELDIFGKYIYKYSN